MTGLLITLLLISGSARGSGAVGDLYNEANALYRAGDYEYALERYESIVATGLRNDRLHYNLGNAAFKAGRLGRAIVAYERVLRLSPGDEDARANLVIANARKVDRVESEEQNVVTRVAKAMYRALGIGFLAVVSCLSLFGIALLGIVRLLRPSARTFCAASGGIVFVVGVISLALLLTKVEDRNRPEAVIVAEQADGRSGPGEDFLKVFTLHEGTKVGVERSEGRWTQVRLPNGIGGWLPAVVLLEI